jgi:signal peptidase II
MATAAATLLLDQLTKAWVRGQLELHAAVPLLGDFVRLRFVKNAGAAFGLFQGSRFLFIAISLVSVAVVLYLILSGRYRFRGSQVAFGLVLGGALGNLVDRFLIPEVIDFIDVGIGLHRWPTFNVADIGVTLGVLYLAASFLVGEWEGRVRAEPARVDPPAAGPVETRSDG